MTSLIAIDPQVDLDAKCCRAIVETPQGSRSKFDYDPATGLFELAAVLPAGMAFPLSFGFVPGTRGEDGDPLDILILSEEILPMGTLVPVQLIGVIEAEQTEKGKTVRNDRLLGKVAASHLWADVDHADQLGKSFSDDLEQFFQTYNDLRGRRFALKKVAGPKHACLLIQKAATERVSH
jgi:inorganic pyrophosphatase